MNDRQNRGPDGWLRNGALGVLLGLIGLSALGAEPKPPETIEQLKVRISAVLAETHTPGVGLALVRADGPEWIGGIGWADIEARKPVTEDTLFRIGSVSKAFVSLSVLKLQEEGKLNLDDTLRSRAPDLKFENRWEETDPVRVVHLLEHTAGWDDLAPKDYAFEAPNEMSLRDCLAFNPAPRHSRWKPGTRYSYSNAGPAAAAYVVENVTGRRFEDYVQENWFGPLHMDTASYFDTPEVRGRLARLYHDDGKTPYPYWHLITRPSGAINASAKDMANYLQLYLNRGIFRGVRLLPATAIDRMERPTTTYGAKEGLPMGYALSNYTTLKNGRVWHGHDGGVFGGLTDFAYLPEAGVGYVVMINSGSGRALNRIVTLISQFLARGLPPPKTPPAAPVPSEISRTYTGWYEPMNPRFSKTEWSERLTGVMRVRFDATGMKTKALFQSERKWVPVTERLFRGEKNASPTFALIADQSDGVWVQEWMAFRRVPVAWLIAKGVISAAGILLSLGTLGFALVWVPRRIFGELSDASHLSVRVLPLLAVLSASAALIVSYASANSPDTIIDRLGKLTAWSATLCTATTAFAVFAAAGLIQAWRYRRAPIHRLVWWQAFVTSAVLVLVALYLAHYGVIGWCSWT